VRLLCLGAALVACVLATGVARADDIETTRKLREHYARGTTLFDLGRYDEAIKEFEAAYETRNDPTLLYNIGQSHRLAHRPQQAIHFYKAYLAREPNAPTRARVEERIIELERQLPAQPQQLQPQPGQQQLITTPMRTVDKPAAPRRPVRPRLVAGIGLGVVGLGLTVGGIVLAVLSGHASDQLTAANTNHLPYDPRLYSTYQNDGIAGGIMLGLGVAALGSGGVLIGLDVKRERARRGDVAFNF
jgi:tetratricopeptide (TPR) repeat protein